MGTDILRKLNNITDSVENDINESYDIDLIDIFGTQTIKKQKTSNKTANKNRTIQNEELEFLLAYDSQYRFEHLFDKINSLVLRSDTFLESPSFRDDRLKQTINETIEKYKDNYIIHEKFSVDLVIDNYKCFFTPKNLYSFVSLCGICIDPRTNREAMHGEIYYNLPNSVFLFVDEGHYKEIPYNEYKKRFQCFSDSLNYRLENYIYYMFVMPIGDIE